MAMLAANLESWGASWLQVEALGVHLGSKLAVLGASWLQVGGPWGHPGCKLGVLGRILAPSWEVLGPSWLQVGGLGHHVGLIFSIELHICRYTKNLQKPLFFQWF